MNECENIDCQLPKYCKGYCTKHYHRFKKWGDSNTVKTADWQNKPYINGEPITNHELYHTWINMKQRCYRPNSKAYKYYGGRGIEVCPRWKSSFYHFYEDMGDRPSPKHQIDRIDNDGDYEPENCRWVIQKRQANNKRNNRLLTLDGVTKTLADWSRVLGIKQSTLTQRLNAYNWTVEKTLTKPVRKRG